LFDILLQSPGVLLYPCRRSVNKHKSMIYWHEHVYVLLQGCLACNCQLASESSQCDDTTGQCRCKPGVTGRMCERCQSGFWNYSRNGCVCESNSWNSEIDTIMYKNPIFTSQQVLQPGAAFEGGEWGDCPRPRSWGGPAIQAYEFVKLYSPVNWKFLYMLRLKSFFKVKFRSVVLGCLLYRNRHNQCLR